MKSVCIIVCLIFSFCSFAQQDQTEKSQLTLLNRTVNFGDVKPDTTLTAKFFFVNTGKQLVEVDYINPDCTCTKYVLSSNVLKPGDTAYVELSVNTTGRYGRNRVHSTMKANTFVKMYKFTIAFTTVSR